MPPVSQDDDRPSLPLSKMGGRGSRLSRIPVEGERPESHERIKKIARVSGKRCVLPLRLADWDMIEAAEKKAEEVFVRQHKRKPTHTELMKLFCEMFSQVNFYKE